MKHNLRLIYLNETYKFLIVFLILRLDDSEVTLVKALNEGT